MKDTTLWSMSEIEKLHGLFFHALNSVKNDLALGNGINVEALRLPFFTSPDKIPAKLWPYSVEELREHFYGAFFTIQNEQEYKELVVLWILIGGHIWPWHKGYKKPKEGETLEDAGTTYSLNEVGLFKELYSPKSTHTLDELKSAVLNIQLGDDVKLNLVKKEND